MADELAVFHWPVARDGYEWRDLRAVPGALDSSKKRETQRVLIPRGGTAATGKPYDVLATETGLFRMFADLPANETAFLGFAARYGPLGGQVAGAFADPASKEVVYGDTMDGWLAETASISPLIRLWDIIRSRDSASLRSYIYWRPSGAVYYDPDGGRQPDEAHGSVRSGVLIASPNVRPDILRRFAPPERIGPARWYLQRAVNAKLALHGVVARLLWDGTVTKLGLHFVPDGLIGALWLQFAQAIEGEKRHRQCNHCRRWYEVGGNRSARADKLFCTPTCKANCHRAKKGEAVRMAVAGVAIAEVAKKLGTKPATVRGWLKKG